MFTKDIGIDLGTANTLVYMKGRGIIMREPSVVAVDPRSDELRVRSVGHEAKAVIGRAPGSIVAVRPLKDGVIADFDVTAAMLQSFIRQACGNSILARPRVVICVPSGVTEVERRAVRQAAAKAGARQVTVIEEPMAAAIGSGLPTTDAVGSMIVDIGGGTAEVAVISLSGIVASRSVRCAGDALDQSIIAFIKRKYNLLVGERTAEQIKISPTTPARYITGKSPVAGVSAGAGAAVALGVALLCAVTTSTLAAVSFTLTVESDFWVREVELVGVAVACAAAEDVFSAPQAASSATTTTKKAAQKKRFIEKTPP